MVRGCQILLKATSQKVETDIFGPKEVAIRKEHVGAFTGAPTPVEVHFSCFEEVDFTKFHFSKARVSL